MTKSIIVLAGLALGVGLGIGAPAQAETVMQQCGQQYQAAKSAGTLNGMNWNQFRTDCAAKLKAQPASTTVPTEPTVPAPVSTATNPLKPATPPTPARTTLATSPAPTTAPPATKTMTPATGGRAAMLTRERQCGAEWRAQKVSLVAATPGLTWPKYWSQCNTRLKAAGQ